jgi:hypothetical protein
LSQGLVGLVVNLYLHQDPCLISPLKAHDVPIANLGGP